MLFAGVIWISLGLITGLIALAILTGIVVFMWRYQLTFIQGFLLGLNAFMNRFRWGTRVDRPMPIAPGEGAIIIANHRSGFDPMFLQGVAPRIIHWMFAKEFGQLWWLGWFFRAVGAIPAGRGGIDTAAVKQAIRLASGGELVGMMPEGRINETDALLLPGRPGVALIALKARVPVIPCFISGAPYTGTTIGPLFKSAQVRVAIGDPIDISEFYGREKEPGVLEDLTKRFLKAIAHLAGVDDFEPQLAGRRWKTDEPVADEGDGDERAAELKRPA